MPQVLDCRYTSGDRNVIRLTADLNLGWRNLGDAWGFDRSGFLNYEIGSKFRCQLRFAAQAPEAWETRTKPPQFDWLSRYWLGNNLAMIYGPSLVVDVPLGQEWRRADDEPHHPSIYAFEPSLFSVETADGEIQYQLQLWAALHGPTQKFARHEYDWGDGFAWVGRA